MAILMNKKLIFAVAAAAIVIVGAATFLRHSVAPEVTFATLSGERLATSDLRGKVLLVNFWATSCAPCVAEMPRMIETYQKFAPRGYEMIAVAMSHDHPNQVAAFTQSRALPFKVVLDGEGAIAKSFGNVRITPTTFLIDKRGRILMQYQGEPQWSELHALVEEALSDPA